MRTVIPINVPRPAVFTEADAERAYDEWGANCGPGALAGILGLSLDEVRPHLRGFAVKGYTNPMMMFEALNSLGVVWKKQRPGNLGRCHWPEFGLARIQWEIPGVPIRALGRFTHWVGTAVVPKGRGVFDINCINNGQGWASLHDWETIIVPHLLKQYPRSNGKWYITNALEITGVREVVQ